MNLTSIQLRYVTAQNKPQVVSLADLNDRTAKTSNEDGIDLWVTFDRSYDEAIARTTVRNSGDEPVRLDSVWFQIATGFDPRRPARFFKHGYQSWSASGGAAAGAGEHRRDRAPAMLRMCHQSELRRPSETPEASTSELFTVVESAGIADRVLAGFIGGAHALTTVSAVAPDQLTARALLDGVALAPDEVLTIEPLMMIAARQSAAHMAERWAARLGAAMNARTRAAFQRGWCSWYHYFHAITEDAMRANLKALKELRTQFPVDVVQLDDGFQSALGDWDTTNSKFPSGLQDLADEIRDAGFAAGIWTAPFLASRDSRVMSAHPEWFIKGADGAPLRAGRNSNWASGEDKFAYALDPSNPEFREHLQRLFHRLVSEFGYSYLKLDFLYAGAAEGGRHDLNMTRAETLRAGLDSIRAGAGERAFILGCGCPLGPAVGVVDGMRIGPDVSPSWGGAASGDPSTVYALDAIIARSFMHRRLWLNDPDCLMLREKETSLTGDERAALATVIAGSGGMVLISDDMSLLDAVAADRYQAALSLAAEMDLDAAHAPVLALDLLSDGGVRGMAKVIEHGATVVLVNRSDAPDRIGLSELGVGSGEFSVGSIGRPSRVTKDPIGFLSHTARIVRMKK